MLYSYIIVFIVAVLTCVYATKKTIFISIRKQLFDEPSQIRKIHSVKTPNLGGVAIFSAFCFTMTVFSSYFKLNSLDGALVAGAIIIFFVGLTDDLSAISPLKKLGGQVSAALLVCLVADLRIKSLNGFLGIYEIPFLASISISVFFIIFVINAYNLVDGANWLAGTTTLVGTITFSYLFYQVKELDYFIACLTLSGCIGAFLFFNKTPARIFMGDSGSLFLGYSIAIFSLHFLQLVEVKQGLAHPFSNSIMIVLSIISMPVLDTIRVFCLRLRKQRSPFEADKNHFHHILLSKGFSHLQTSSIFSATITVLIVLTLANKGSMYSSLALIIALPIALMILVHQIKPEHFKPLANKSEKSPETGKLVLVHSKQDEPSTLSKTQSIHAVTGAGKVIKNESMKQLLEEPA